MSSGSRILLASVVVSFTCVAGLLACPTREDTKKPSTSSDDAADKTSQETGSDDGPGDGDGDPAPKSKPAV